MDVNALRIWPVVALNLPEHASNPVHTDEGARAVGFARALVAGVTTYAYLCHVPLAAWGREWLRTGRCEVRFFAPIFDREIIVCTPTEWVVDAMVEEDLRVELNLGCAPVPAGSIVMDGPITMEGSVEWLEPTRVDLGVQWDGYADRAGDHLRLDGEPFVHPAVWPALANHMFHNQVVRGPWVHTRSRVQHHSLGVCGEEVEVTGEITRRYTKRSGERAVALIEVRSLDGWLRARIEHEAIVALPTP